MDVCVTMQDDQTAVLVVTGRVDASNYTGLQAAVDALDKSVERIVFDFRDVEYVSSAGLRVLMSAAKKAGEGNVSIINVDEDVRDILHTVGYDALFQIEQAEEGSATYIGRSFKEILELHARRYPDVPLVTHLDREYTWRDIDICSQIVADDLRRMGVGKGSHVGICSANSANWIITFFAVQKLSAIACLMNFNYNAREIADVSGVGDITHLCYGEIATMGDDADAFLAEIMGYESSKIASTYDIRNSVEFRDRYIEYADVRGRFGDKVEADDVCVMIYTSGSTGTPKGVLLSAYNILNASEAMSEEIEIGDEDRLCLIIPLFHIFGMTAGFFCNAIRNAHIIIPENIRTNTILMTIGSYQCTLFHSVPTMILALMNNKEFSADKVAKLRCVLLAGAPATEAQIHKMQETFPQTHFVCAYGLSEMAPVSMTKYDDTTEHVATTVGLPVSNIQISVVNTETGEECDLGVSGEIIVEGYNLMCSYYKASLDKQAVDDSGWLHTGDLGFFSEDGYLHLSGRAKELIIRGGENIMPSEITEVISEFPNVADVKVQGVPDDFFGEVVGASVIMKDDQKLDVDGLMGFLRGRLAKYKLPAFVFQYDTFPMLSNGKVDAVSLKKDMNAKAAELRAR